MQALAESQLDSHRLPNGAAAIFDSSSRRRGESNFVDGRGLIGGLDSRDEEDKYSMVLAPGRGDDGDDSGDGDGGRAVCAIRRGTAWCIGLRLVHHVNMSIRYSLSYDMLLRCRPVRRRYINNQATTRGHVDRVSVVSDMSWAALTGETPAPTPRATAPPQQVAVWSRAPAPTATVPISATTAAAAAAPTAATSAAASAPLASHGFEPGE